MPNVIETLIPPPNVTETLIPLAPIEDLTHDNVLDKEGDKNLGDLQESVKTSKPEVDSIIAQPSTPTPNPTMGEAMSRRPSCVDPTVPQGDHDSSIPDHVRGMDPSTYLCLLLEAVDLDRDVLEALQESMQAHHIWESWKEVHKLSRQERETFIEDFIDIWVRQQGQGLPVNFGQDGDPYLIWVVLFNEAILLM